MKRIFSIFLCVVVLGVSFSCFIFSSAASAPFTFNSSLQMPGDDSDKWQLIFADSSSNGYLIVLESSIIPLFEDGWSRFFTATYNIPSLEVWTTQNVNSYSFLVTVFDLSSGNQLNSFAVSDSFNNTNHFTISFPVLSSYLTSNHVFYCYPLYSGLIKDGTMLINSDPFVHWYTVTFTDDVIRSFIPQPLSNVRTLYFADHLNLYQFFLCIPPQYQGAVDPVSGSSSNSYTLQVGIDYFPYLDISHNNVTASFQLSNVTVDYPIVVNKFDVVSGEFLSSNTYTFDHLTGVDINIVAADIDEYGYYQSGFYPLNDLSDVGLLKISWSDTIDYSSKFESINTLLNSILDKVSILITQDINYYTVVSSFINDFFNTDWEDATNFKNWSYYLDMVQSFSYNMTIFARDFNSWYQSVYIPKTDLTNQLLEDIYEVLGGGEEVTELDTSANQAVDNAVNDYASAEQAVMGDYQAGADQAFANGGQVFNGNGAFAWISAQIQNLVINNPSLNALIIFSLTIGIAVLIIGRRINV